MTTSGIRIIELFERNIEKDQTLWFVYAIILVTILGIELIALVTIFILAGCGILSYSDTALNLFITGGIAEIFVLVKVIVEYLFKDNLTETLKIIITSNNKKNNYKNKDNKNSKTTDKPWKFKVFSNGKIF